MNKKKLITLLLVVVGILMVTFFVRDWLVFYRCGAVEQCLIESSNYQNIAKFAVTAIMTVVVFFIGGNCLCRRDRNFLQAGFAMALCADFCLKIMHNYTRCSSFRNETTRCLASASSWWCRPCSSTAIRVRATRTRVSRGFCASRSR